MKYTIHSTIEYEHMECSADMINKEPLIHHESSGLLEEKEEKEEKSESPDGSKFRHKSEAHSNENRFFHRVRVDRNGVSQITNVNVNIQPDQQDPCNGCFKGIVSMFKKS